MWEKRDTSRDAEGTGTKRPITPAPKWRPTGTQFPLPYDKICNNHDGIAQHIWGNQPDECKCCKRNCGQCRKAGVWRDPSSGSDTPAAKGQKTSHKKSKPPVPGFEIWGKEYGRKEKYPTAPWRQENTGSSWREDSSNSSSRSKTRDPKEMALTRKNPTTQHPTSSRFPSSTPARGEGASSSSTYVAHDQSQDTTSGYAHPNAPEFRWPNMDCHSCGAKAGQICHPMCVYDPRKHANIKEF